MKKFFYTTFLCSSLLLGGAALAGSHPLTKVVFDKTSGISYVDQVVHIDWDIDNPPSLVIDGVSTPLNKAYINSIMEIASDLLYTMTEGRMRLGKISVYSNTFLDRADMQILNKSGRPNAHLDGIDVLGMRNQNFTQPFGEPANVTYIGKTIAHEFGHYFFGLLDEYREVGNFKTEDPGSPQDRDTPRPTIMNSQMDFSRFSTPADYSDTTKRQTAQYRWFGRSAWETLVADPATDLPHTKADKLRTWFDSFKGMSVPTTLAVPIDASKSRSSLQLTFMKNTRVAYVFDLNVTQPELDGFIKAATASINAMPAGTIASSLTFSGGSFVEIGTVTLGAGADDPMRQVARDSFLSHKAMPGTGFTGLNNALRRAAVLVSPLAAAQDNAAKIGLPAPLTTSVEIAATPAIELFTTTASTVLPETQTALVNGAVMLIAEMLNKGNGGNMETVAKATRGSPAIANSAAELEKKVLHHIHALIGDSMPNIATQKYDSFAAGAKLEMKFLVASKAIDGKVVLEALVGPNVGMSLELKTPGGITVNEFNAASLGITYKNNILENSLSYYIPTTFPNRTGNWTATLSAINSSVAPVELEAETESKLSVAVSIIGGTKEDPRSPMITAIVQQPVIVKNANVKVDIYDATGMLVKKDLVLTDDGLGVDLKPGDGVYSASLEGILTKSGDYDVEVHVTNGDLTAAYGTGGALSAGANARDVVIGESFLREENLDFAFFSNSLAAQVTEAMSGGGGGGCTLGRGAPFDPVFPLLVAGAGLYLLRRKSPDGLVNESSAHH